MIKSNYHTHTKFCDGSDEPEAYVKEAIKLGFNSLGFSGHAPFPKENTFAIKDNDLENYCNNIEFLKNKYQNIIKVYIALEVDYIPEITEDFHNFYKKCNLDYIIGSVHLVLNPENKKLWFIDGPKEEIYDKGLEIAFNNNIRQAVKAYYYQINRMIETQEPDVIGHLDKIKMHNKNRFFSEDEKWYQNLISETLMLSKEKNCIIEVNTRGLYKKRCDSLFPGKQILKQIHSMKIPIVVNSDAHKPSELTLGFDQAIKELKSIGFKNHMTFSVHGWEKIEL
ncbi:MAG: histidinol-phosphatase HisJ [Bacteroidales bacterium]|nr:histidinol-phosphatase HisJ [Bacteroidales bacterium]